MITAPELAGPHRPEPITPQRRPGSVRRTATIDSTRPDGMEGDLAVDARGRDLSTGRDLSAGAAGTPVVLAQQRLSLSVDGGGVVLSVAADPAVPGIDDLVGASTAAGFRREVLRAVPAEVEGRTLAHLLADDLVGAVLVSGYARQRAGLIGIRREDDDASAAIEAMADVCAGWATDASILVTFRGRGEVPAPLGPVAPLLEPADDPWSWHATASLSPHAVRRRRRLDAWWEEPGERFGVDAHFRDSHVDADGIETVVHEYTVRGEVAAADRTVLAMEADARVLPWHECPQAVASAAGVVGVAVGDLPDLVRHEFRGVGTCTHLNDVLRGLGDLGPLLDHVT